MRHFTYSNRQRSRAKLLTKDEARRIAANVAKLPELLPASAAHEGALWINGGGTYRHHGYVDVEGAPLNAPRRFPPPWSVPVPLAPSAKAFTPLHRRKLLVVPLLTKVLKVAAARIARQLGQQFSHKRDLCIVIDARA
jgi:hypothetical protein